MSQDLTAPQGDEDRLRSQELSLRRVHPPAQVPGYDLERFLGAGAYGEVWVAVEKNTGRRVAIKFYAHRGGLDWSLLAREVEKLAILFADRHVVQLIGVGWEAEPPYYVMEYLEEGSLAERLQQGTLGVDEALALFRDVAVGLLHAHGKGILHCDLKPANVLLDRDGKPRLADFGQSRLSHEQTPTLGTLFYMAPEQADPAAMPDARWDVYALGALLYCMLAGSPPHRTGEMVQTLERTTDLGERLAIYRRKVRKSAAPSGHRLVPGVDRALAEIIDRCLAPDPARRYPNVQAVIHALDTRRVRRARRPALVLGLAAPLALLAVFSAFAWKGFSAAVKRSQDALTARALDNNLLTADYVAGLASKEIARRYDAAEQVASDVPFRQFVAETLAKPELGRLLVELSDPKWAREDLSVEESRRRDALWKQFREHPERAPLQREFDRVIPSWIRPSETQGRGGQVASWFFCDANGVSIVRSPESETIGKNYAWRSFFHGGPRDLEKTWRPPLGEHISATRLSAVFRSQATQRWIVAVSTPVYDTGPQRRLLGVVALTVQVNRFVELEGNDDQFAVLVERRPGDHTGRILQHPLFDKLAAINNNMLPQRVEEYRLAADELPVPSGAGRIQDYRDPVAADPEGEPYDKRWLAQSAPVPVRKEDSGWAVIVQESYLRAVGAPLAQLRHDLATYGLAAAAVVLLVLTAIWAFAMRMLNQSVSPRGLPAPGMATESGFTSATPRSKPESQDPRPKAQDPEKS